jgi:hypothetical protein
MSPDELRASIPGEGTLLRIELRLAGDDPRIALRERLPEHAELEAIYDYLLVESTGISEPLPLAEPRRGRRTVLTLPLLPPPQKN